MKRFIFLLLALLLPARSQAQVTVTFEGTDQLAAHGFVASGLVAKDVSTVAPNPYVAWTNSPTSGTGIVYNSSASYVPVRIQRADGGAFTFNGGAFTSLYAISENMYFRGYTSLASYQASRDFVPQRRPDLNDGAYYFLAAITAAGPTSIGLDWHDLIVLELGSTGGDPLDPHGFSADNFEGFAGDDFRFDYAVAPEPSSLVLLGTGLLAFVALRRRWLQT